jgi:hypothetical protein
MIGSLVVMILIDPIAEDHILKRLRETDRGCDTLGSDWLYGILHLINSFVPDDWRLSRHKNAFVIRIIGDHDVTFVGKSFRSPSNYEHIYHLISTVIPRGGVLKEALDENEKRLAASAPNLYVMDGHSGNNFITLSPIAARQYEKRNPDDASYEYHRLHLLDKRNRPALDPSRWIWIKWHRGGDMELDKTPEDNWRGTDYWKLEEILDSDSDKESELREHYRDATRSARRTIIDD